MVTATSNTLNIEGTSIGDLRGPGALLLVSCYELGHQPLALATAAAALRADGFQPALRDIAVEELSDSDLQHASLIMISVPMHTAMRLGQQVLQRVHEVNPKTPIVFFGLYALLNAENLFTSGADAVIGGEFDQALSLVAGAVAEGCDLDALPLPGVSTPSRRHPEPPDRSQFPVPARDQLPMLRNYAGLEHDGIIVRAGYVEATRGCHHTCTHCPITPVYGGRLVVVPRANVIDDIAQQVEVGARHVTFGDPDFFNGPTHALRILDEMKGRWPELTFDATIKIEHILEHRKRLPELARHDCQFVVSAVESLNEMTLQAMKKGHNAKSVAEAIRLLDDVGVPMRPSLLPFSPWETIDSYLHLLRFMAAHGMVQNIDPVHWSIRLLIPPGSAVLDNLDTASWLGPLDADALSFRWTHPDPRMDVLQRQIAELAEAGADCQQDASATFAQIWSAAHAAAGLPVPEIPATKIHRPKPPRLTESWFC